MNLAYSDGPRNILQYIVFVHLYICHTVEQNDSKVLQSIHFLLSNGVFSGFVHRPASTSNNEKTILIVKDLIFEFF